MKFTKKARAASAEEAKTKQTTDAKQAEAVKNNTADDSMFASNLEPILSGLLGSWRLIPVEDTDSEACEILNKACGIDYLLCSKGNYKVYGVVSRVQYGKNYRIFVVPKDSTITTETIGSLSPHYTMQVYITDNKTTGLALVETKGLMDFIDRGLARENRTDYICSWDDMTGFGYKVIEYGSASSAPRWSGKVCCNGSPDIINSCKNRFRTYEFETDDIDTDEQEKLHETWRRIHEHYAEDRKEKPDTGSIICGICEITDILNMLEQLNQENYYLSRSKRGLSHNY